MHVYLFIYIYNILSKKTQPQFGYIQTNRQKTARKEEPRWVSGVPECSPEDLLPKLQQKSPQDRKNYDPTSELCSQQTKAITAVESESSEPDTWKKRAPRPNPAAARAESCTEDAFVWGTMLHAYTSEKVKGQSLADAWRRSAPCPYKRFMMQMYGEEVLQAVHNAEAATAGARAKPEKKGICDTENVPVCYLGG